MNIGVAQEMVSRMFRGVMCKFKTKIKRANKNCPRLVDIRNNQGMIELRVTKCTGLVSPKFLRRH